MTRPAILLACLLSAAAAAPAFAQAPSQIERFDRQLEQIQRQSRMRVDESVSPNDRAIFDHGALLSLSYVTLDDPAGKSHGLRQAELIGYGRANFDGAHEFFIRGRAAYNDFNDGESFDGRGDYKVMPRIERFHYRFDLQRALGAYEGKSIDYNIVLQGGRQLVTWANGLTLSEVIDGGIATINIGKLSLDLLAGVTYDKDVDFDVSRPNFRSDTTRRVFGAMASIPIVSTPSGEHRIFAYGLVQRDDNGSETLVTDSVTTRFDYNSYYIGVGASGNFGDNLLYGVEFVYEGGHTLSNSTDPADSSQLLQTRDQIQAFALDARLDYVLADPRRTKFSAELILASGDSDRIASNTTLGGNKSGTHDNSFNALGLLNTGLAFAPAVSNVAIGRVGASTFPMPDSSIFKQMQLGTDFLVFNKMVRDGPIDEPTSDGRYLGTEGDFYMNWQVTSDVSLSMRYGIFFPGSAISGDSSPRNFFFLGVSYAF